MSIILQIAFIFFLIKFFLILALPYFKTENNLLLSLKMLLSSVFACLAYCVPMNTVLTYYEDTIEIIPFVQYLEPFSAGQNPFQYTIFEGLWAFLLGQLPFIMFFGMYFLVVKNGSRWNISYFVRYHCIHSLLISVMQIPLSYCYLYCLGFNNATSALAEGVFLNLRCTVVMVHMALIAYGALCASLNKYVNIPLVTSACRFHLGEGYEKQSLD